MLCRIANRLHLHQGFCWHMNETRQRQRWYFIFNKYQKKVLRVEKSRERRWNLPICVWTCSGETIQWTTDSLCHNNNNSSRSPATTTNRTNKQTNRRKTKFRKSTLANVHRACVAGWLCVHECHVRIFGQRTMSATATRMDHRNEREITYFVLCTSHPTLYAGQQLKRLRQLPSLTRLCEREKKDERFVFSFTRDKNSSLFLQF